MSEDRAGTVLPAVVLLLLGATLLAHGAFVLARDQHRLARVGVGLTRAEVAARAGLMRARSMLADGGFDSLDVVEGDWGTDGSYRTHRHVLGPEVLLARSEGRVRELPVTVVLGQLLWRLDPVERVLLTGSVVTAATLPSADRVDVGRWWQVPAGVDSLACSGLLDGVAARGGGAAPARMRASADSVSLGRWTLEALLGAAELAVDGAVSPAPDSTGGVCATSEVLNWGDPGGGICGDRRPLVGAAGELRMEGGRGQGILVASGSVVLGAGAHFRGLVLAGGDLSLEPGALLEGAVWAGGGVTAAAGATIRGSACSIGLGLQAAHSLRRPFQLEPGRIPVLR